MYETYRNRHLRKIESRMISSKTMMKKKIYNSVIEDWDEDDERVLYNHDLRNYNKMKNLSNKEYLKIRNSVLEYGKEFRGRIRDEKEFLSRIETKMITDK